MKFCKDCKHYDYLVVNGQSYCTRRVRVVGKSIVDGSDIISTHLERHCHVERESWLPWYCGKNGRYFEEKE